MLVAGAAWLMPWTERLFSLTVAWKREVLETIGPQQSGNSVGPGGRVPVKESTAPKCSRVSTEELRQRHEDG